MVKAATGDGPIRFFTSQGAQVSLPLSAIGIAGDNVQLVISGLDAARTQALQALFTDAAPWLKYLLKQKQLREAPPGPAAIVTAAVAGSAGNRISVKITAVAGDTSKVDIEATMEDAYSGLTLANLGAKLDAMPGMVKLKSVADPAVVPIEQKLPLPAAAPLANPPVAPTWELKGAAGATSFTLEARRPETDKALVTIELKIPQGDPGFTLTATWTAKARVTAAAFENDWVPLRFAATVAPPKTGYKLPRPQTDPIRLAGGADSAAAVQATSATATLIANE